MKIKFYNPAIKTIGMILVLNFVGTVWATIVPVAYYRLGEGDPGAVAGSTGNATTVDSAGSNDLTRTGSPVYSSDVASSAATATGSTFSMDFGSSNAGNVYAIGSPVTSATSNFVMEGWFKLGNTSGGQVLVLNGNGGNGYALYMSGGKLNVLQGGAAVRNTGFIPTANEWFYAALVNEAGVNSVYINNNAPIAMGTFGYNSPTGNFSIGGQVGSNLTKGLADEVRISTFTAGQFSTNDLLINVPEPTSFAMLLFGSMVLWAVRRKRR